MICVTKGPGSFAGVRVGLSVAKAIRMATNIDTISISTLETIASYYPNEKVAVVMDARQNNIFVQLFDRNNFV